NFWLEPSSGHTYFLVVQSPLDKLRSMEDLANIPLRGSTAPENGRPAGQYLGNVAEVSRAQIPAEVTHTNGQTTFDIMANVEGVSQGSVAAAVQRIIAEESAGMPKGVVMEMAGQSLTMEIAFDELGKGLIAAVVLVYLIMVINFQSWSDPFII